MVLFRNIIGAILVLSLSHPSGRAAEQITDILRNNTPLEQHSAPESDYELFSQPIESSDIFSGIIASAAPRVAYRIANGVQIDYLYTLNGMALESALNGRADFAMLSALRVLCATENWRNYDLSPSQLPTQTRIRATYGDRAPRVGLSAQININRDNWTLSAFVERRWGRDAHISSVFADNYAASIAVERRFGKSTTLSMAAGVAPTEQGLRSATTLEAFDLTGDNLYNPSWGYQQGRVRNSRVATSFNPFAALIFRHKISATTQVSFSAVVTSLSGGTSFVSRFEGSNPYPDYYYNMPSFYPQGSLQNSYVEQRWREGSSEVTQLDWGGMYSMNHGSTTPIFILEQRRERSTTARFRAAIGGAPSNRTKVEYGIEGFVARGNLYKLAGDMLGCQPFLDRDQYLDDGGSYGDMSQNNLLIVGRLVGRGDRFGYDALMLSQGISAHGSVEHRSGIWHLVAEARVGIETLRREGRYEKELYPAGGSLGPSRRLAFDTYNIQTKAMMTIAAGHTASLEGGFSSQAPLYGTIFLSPCYNNATIANPRATQSLWVRARYDAKLHKLHLQATGGVLRRSNLSEVMRYYDDLASTYCDLVLKGIATTYLYGEVGADLQIGRSLRLKVAAHVARAQYSSNPEATLLADDSHVVLQRGSRSYMDGYRLGNIPSCTFTAALDYFGTRGWWARLSVANFSGSRVDPSPTRRMSRVMSGAGSPEAYRAMISQHKLPSATRVNALISKNISLKDGMKLNLRLNVDNLLSGRNIVVYGYEQARLRRVTSGQRTTLVPLPERYLYDYGRTYRISITFTL